MGKSPKKQIKYVNFPLSELIGLGNFCNSILYDSKERINKFGEILSFSIINDLSRFIAKNRENSNGSEPYAANEYGSEISNILELYPELKKYDAETIHSSALDYCEYLQWEPNFKALCAGFYKVRSRLDSFEKEHCDGRKDAYCFVFYDLFVDAAKGAFEIVDFAVYAAIRSKVGKEIYKTTTRNEISRRASGYKSAAVSESYRAEYDFSDSYKPIILSERQIDTRLKRLKESKLISVYSYKGAHKLYISANKARTSEYLEKIVRENSAKKPVAI